jgi:hypothetical protein
MLFDRDRRPAGLRMISFALAAAVLALHLQQSFVFAAGSGLFSFANASVTKPLPQQNARIVFVSVADWRDANSNLNPLFLRIDYKQNLLMWPVIAGDLTRSPPPRGMV